MDDLSPSQAALLLALLTFIPFLFQNLQLLAAQPFLAPHLDRFVKWLQLKAPWLPGSDPAGKDKWKRIGVWTLSIFVFLLFRFPTFDALPGPVEATDVYFTAILTYGTAALFKILGYIGYLHGIYKYIWKRLFESKIPVLKELSADKIDAQVAENK